MAKSYKQSKTLHCTQIVETYCNIVYFIYTNTNLDTNDCLSYSCDENID